MTYLPRLPYVRTAAAVAILALAAFLLVTVGSVTAQNTNQAPARRGATTIVNLRDLGASGDGSTNDSDALQRGLDLLADAGGGTIEVPAGHYRLATPVTKQFNFRTNLSIVGEASATVIDVAGNGTGLDLSSEFIVATGETNTALTLTDINSLLIKEISFVGVKEVMSDAQQVLSLNNIGSAEVQHCEFYGLASFAEQGAILLAHHSNLKLEQCAFLGCAADSGVTTSLVQNIAWLGVSITDCKFVDYGNRPDFFSKTTLQSPYSWISIGDAAGATADAPLREAILRNVFLDEGSYFGVSVRPDLAQAEILPFDLYMSRLYINVNNLGSDGVLVVGGRHVLIDQSHLGWSHNAGYAINLSRTGEAILDLVDCSDDATRFNVDADRLAIINSTNTALNSTAPVMQIIHTDTADEDPSQFVRIRYNRAFNAEPAPAGQFYWTSRLLRCADDMNCLTETRAALDSFLQATPAEQFSIDGQVVDETGVPVSGAAVNVTGFASLALTTDGGGRFRLSNLNTAAAYTITATSPHYDFQSREIMTPTSDQVITLAGTRQRHNIAGRVFEDTGRPLSGATVTLTGGKELTAVTDGDGDYNFPDLPGGDDYVITVACEDFSFHPDTQSFVNLSADNYAVFEGTENQFTIVGRVTGLDNQSLPAIKVTLGGPQTATVFTNSEGAYSFKVFAGDNYTVTPTDSHWTFAPAFAVISDLSVNQKADFHGARNTHSIGGRVFATTGRPLANATLSLSGSSEATTTSDANGDFLFSDLDAGSNYVVSVSRANYIFTVSSKSFFDVTSDQYVAFEGALRSYTIAGNVRNESGSNLSNVVVNLNGAINATAVTNGSGTYSFTVPGENDYSVTVSLLNYAFNPSGKSFPNVSANQIADFDGGLVDFVVSGNIVTSEGLNLSGVVVSVSGSDTAEMTTSHTANYAFSLAAQGDYVITPSKSNYTFSPASIALDNLTANHELNFTATLNTGVPVLLAAQDPTRALAWDAVLHTGEPFKSEYDWPWAADRRTRVMVFVKHFDLLQTEGAANLQASAEDRNHVVHPLQVEWAGKVDGSDWLIGVVICLDSQFAAAGDVPVRITHNGLTSEPLVIRFQP